MVSRCATTLSASAIALAKTAPCFNTTLLFSATDSCAYRWSMCSHLLPHLWQSASFCFFLKKQSFLGCSKHPPSFQEGIGFSFLQSNKFHMLIKITLLCHHPPLPSLSCPGNNSHHPFLLPWMPTHIFHLITVFFPLWAMPLLRFFSRNNKNLPKFIAALCLSPHLFYSSHPSPCFYHDPRKLFLRSHLTHASYYTTILLPCRTQHPFYTKLKP